MRAAFLIVLFTARAASANPLDTFKGGSWLHYELTGLHGIEDATGSSGAQDLVLAGFRLHGFAGLSETIGLHIGIDAAAGGSFDAGGFAYDVAFFPAGVAVRLGDTNVIALGVGIGASGATSALDDAMTMPLELNVELGGGPVRLLGRGRVSYVGYSDSRQGGAPSLSFGDELDATVGVRIGRHYDEFNLSSGNGYFLGAAYREMAGTRFVGLVIGYSIDAATERKRSRRYRDDMYGCADCD